MKNAVLKYELQYWFRSPVFYLLSGFFFLFAFVTMIGTAGYFDGPIDPSEKSQWMNAPYYMSSTGFLFAKFLLFMVAVFAGFGLYRDYRNNAHAILYTFPISKNYYLNGKLSSSLIVLALSCLIVFSGILFGEFLAGTEYPKIGPFNPMSYLVTLGVYLLPTMLVIGVFVFVIVGITRSIFSGFMTVICFVLFQSILENVFFNQPSLLALLDPFGQFAFQSVTHDWNYELKNSTALPINGLVLANRLFWLLAAFVVYFVFHKKFDFQYHKIWETKNATRSNKSVILKNELVDNKSEISFDFSLKARINSFFQLMIYDCKSILKNRLFLLLCAFGGLAIFFIQFRICNSGEFNLFPLTRIFIGAPLSMYALIVTLSTFLFSGLLVHKAKQNKMDHLVDVTPVRNWQLIGSKVGAMTLVQMVQLFLFMLIGVGIQIYNGYFYFEIGLYLFHLFILVLPVLLVWNIISFFAHSFLPNILIGLFLLGCIWMGAQSMEQLNVQTYLLKFNTLPELTYSDFNGYGSQLKGYFLVMAYWLVFGLVLLFAMSLIWNRGSLSTLKERWTLLKARMNKPLIGMLTLMVVSFLWLGCKVYNAEMEDKENTEDALGGLNTIFRNYKTEWKKYGGLTLPKINYIDLEIDVFPDEERFEANGAYQLINNSEKKIDTVLVRTGFDEITELKWNVEADLLLENKTMKTYLFKLEKPLAVGDTVNFNFKIKNTPNTLFSRNSNVLSDGSFIMQDILPRIGYQFIEHELPMTDSTVHKHNNYHRDADVLNIRTRISTSEDQTAIAPGQLIKQELRNNRNYYEYKTAHPVKFNFSFHSAKFKILREKYGDVEIELFCTKRHENNASLMMDGLKASLDYNTKRFGEYPYDQIRIVEFPHTERGYSATLTTNNIPTSEVLFNINAELMADKIILPFYVMAHELTHEWFGNQVAPADAEGSKMLTESITEYITLCIYRDCFGDEIAANFLEVQNKRYERGRNREKRGESPLYKVRGEQQYLAYGKGAIAFYAIAQVIGADKMDLILSEYVNKYKNEIKNYPTTADLILIFKKHTTSMEFEIVEKWLMTNEEFDFDALMNSGK